MLMSDRIKKMEANMVYQLDLMQGQEVSLIIHMKRLSKWFGQPLLFYQSLYKQHVNPFSSTLFIEIAN